MQKVEIFKKRGIIHLDEFYISKNAKGDGKSDEKKQT